MYSRKDLVIRAITFGGPERVPVLYINHDHEEGDVMMYHLSLGRKPKSCPPTGKLFGV